MLKVAKVGATVVKGNSMLSSYYGCTAAEGAPEGGFVSKVEPNSAFSSAVPPIKANSFITKVGDIGLDRFAMGTNADYIQDPVSFRDLLFMGHEMTEQKTVTTCSCGTETTHTVDMTWKLAYEGPVEDDQQANLVEHKYLTFGNVTMQALTKTLAHHLILAQGQLDLIPYVMPENEKGVVIVTDVGHSDTGYGGKKLLSVGSVVSEINGKEIQSMSDVEEALTPTCSSQCGAAAGAASAGTDTNCERVFTMKTADGHMHAFDFMAEMHRMAGGTTTGTIAPMLQSAMDTFGITVSTTLLQKEATARLMTADEMEGGVEVLPIEYRNVYRGGMTAAKALDHFLGVADSGYTEEAREEGPARPSSFMQMGPGGVAPFSLMQLGRNKAHPSSFMQMGPKSLEPISLMQLHPNRK